MPNDPEYIALVVQTLAPLGDITNRAMFGGHMLYCDGLPFALVGYDQLYLKVDDQTEPQFLAAGLPAFRPFPDKPDTMRYYLVPEDFFDSPDSMRHWAGLALEAAQRSRKPNKKKR